jgi:hypothetical protein
MYPVILQFSLYCNFVALTPKHVLVLAVSCRLTHTHTHTHTLSSLHKDRCHTQAGINTSVVVTDVICGYSMSGQGK